MTVKIISGTGMGQSAVITDYDGTPREIIIPAWTQTDGTSQYTIYPTITILFTMPYTFINLIFFTTFITSVFVVIITFI